MIFWGSSEKSTETHFYFEIFYTRTCLLFCISDDARDIHGDEDLKRQRNQYNGDQIYSNVIIAFDFMLKLLAPYSKLIGVWFKF